MIDLLDKLWPLVINIFLYLWVEMGPKAKKSYK